MTPERDSPQLQEWLRRHFQLRLEIRQADLLLVTRLDGEIAGVGLGARRGGRSYLAFVGVSLRRRGLGRRLVEEIAQRLGPLTTRFCDVSPFPGVPKESTEFFRRLGFHAAGRECTMRPPLGGFRAPAEIAVEPLDRARVPALRRLLEELEPSWTSALDEKLQRGAEREVLISGDVNGFVMVAAAQPLCFFGPIGVAAAQRRRGLGRALTLHGLAYLQRENGSAVELWTDPDSFLGSSFYPSLGFSVAKMWQNFDYNK